MQLARGMLAVLVMFCGTACARKGVVVTNGSPAQTLGRMPAWYASDARDSARLAGRATAVSADLQTALDIARSEARAELVLQVESRTEAMTKRFREQTGTGRDAVLLSQFTAASRDVAAQTLRGVRTTRHEVQAEGSLYRAYVLLELPAGEAAHQLLDRLRRDEQLRTDARAATAFEELAREVQRHEAAGQRAERPAPRR